MSQFEKHSAPGEFGGTGPRSAVNTEILDISARQRMLNQRLLKDAQAQAFGLDNGLAATSQLLSETAVALLEGGIGTLISGGNREPVRLMQPPTPEIRVCVLQQVQLIGTLNSDLSSLTAASTGSPEYITALKQLLASGDRFHTCADRTTQMYALHFQQLEEAMAARERSMSAQLKSVVAESSAISATLAAAAEEVSAVSRQLKAGIATTASQSALLSDASRRVNENIQSVASAAEQMDSAIRQIASTSSESARVAGQASAMTQSAAICMQQLERSSSEIGGILKLILSVASQTNLLALNATIEAARAGDAGRAFAVVASEVKNLAKQTAGACDDIGGKIEISQRSTVESVAAITQLRGAIDNNTRFADVIARNVDEQSSAVREISSSISSAAGGAANISDAAIALMRSLENQTAGAQDLEAAANELASMAASLQRLITKIQI